MGHRPRAVPPAVHTVLGLSRLDVEGKGADGGRGHRRPRSCSWCSCKGPRQDWATGAPLGRAWGCTGGGTPEGGPELRSTSLGPHPSHPLPCTPGAPPGFKLPRLAAWRTNGKFWKNLGCKSGTLGWQSSFSLGCPKLRSDLAPGEGTWLLRALGNVGGWEHRSPQG